MNTNKIFMYLIFAILVVVLSSFLGIIAAKVISYLHEIVGFSGPAFYVSIMLIPIPIGLVPFFFVKNLFKTEISKHSKNS